MKNITFAQIRKKNTGAGVESVDPVADPGVVGAGVVAGASTHDMILSL